MASSSTDNIDDLARWLIEHKRLMASPTGWKHIPNEAIHDRGLRADRSDVDWSDLEVEGNWRQGGFAAEGMVEKVDDFLRTAGVQANEVKSKSWGGLEKGRWWTQSF